MTSVIPFEPGTINDQLLCAVARLGTNATKAALHQAVPVNNAAIVAVAITALQRQGYMHQHADGHFVLRADVEAELKPVLTTPAAAAAVPTQTAQPNGETTMAKQITCTGPCGMSKDSSEFYGNSKKCKRCTLDRQAALKKAKQDGSAPPAAAKRKAVTTKATRSPAPASIAAAAVYVIPKSGHLECALEGSGPGAIARISQDGASIKPDISQLQKLVTWGTEVLKREGAR